MGVVEIVADKVGKVLGEWFESIEARIAALEGKDAEEAGQPPDCVTLAECPVGLFWHFDTLALKTEYGDNSGRIDAYIVSSGEHFWGPPPQTIESQRACMVQPIDSDFADRALSTPEPESTGDGLRLKPCPKCDCRGCDYCDQSGFAPDLRPHHIEDTGDDKDDSPTQTPSGGSAEVRRQNALDRMLSPKPDEITPAQQFGFVEVEPPPEDTITPEMIEAGLKVYNQNPRTPSGRVQVSAIYRAMTAARESGE